LGYLKMNKNRNCARSYDPSQGRGEEFFLFSFLGLVAMPLAHDKNGDKQFWK